MVYINGRPFVLRDVESPFSNLEYTVCFLLYFYLQFWQLACLWSYYQILDVVTSNLRNEWWQFSTSQYLLKSSLSYTLTLLLLFWFLLFIDLLMSLVFCLIGRIRKGSFNFCCYLLFRVGGEGLLTLTIVLLIFYA